MKHRRTSFRKRYEPARHGLQSPLGFWTERILIAVIVFGFLAVFIYAMLAAFGR